MDAKLAEKTSKVPKSYVAKEQTQKSKRILSEENRFMLLIRTIAMLGVPLLHAAGRWTITPQELSQLSAPTFVTWTVVDIYQSLAVMGVPLFLMLTGALLLQPGKTDSLIGFFSKRWERIGLPALFWGSAYFAWDFIVLNIPFGVSTII